MFQDSFMKNTNATAKENKYVPVKGNITKSEKLEL